MHIHRIHNMAHTEGWSDDSQSTNVAHPNHPNINTGHHPTNS